MISQNMDIKRLVVKIGTTSLTLENGKMDLKKIDKLAWVLTDLRNKGYEIILVSSGAIAVGAERLRLPERPRDIKGKQAASSVGQAILMQLYESMFMQYNQIVSQILITKDELLQGERVKNAKNTFFTLLEWGVIPIANENDTISTEELGFSDNDSLSAYVAGLTASDMLIILSDIDGLYDSDPKTNPDAKMIKEVARIDGFIESIAGGAGTELGTGGMATKISAAKSVTTLGIDVVVASGADPAALYGILEKKETGTLFCGDPKRKARKASLRKRNSLPEELLIQKSKIIAERLLNTEHYKNCEKLFIYLDMGSEAKTRDIIEKALADGKTVALPYAIPKSAKMVFIKTQSLDKLIKSKFGTLEPEYDEKNILEPDEKTLLIVPGAAFDANGYRIGYGGGYYDAYIAKYKTMLNLGVCFDEQLRQKVPADSHDQKIDALITDKEVFFWNI